MKKTCLTLLVLLVTMNLFAQQIDDIRSRYFEMRTYTSHPGKRADLIKRFQDHTLRLFEKSGIENIAYFIPTDENDQTLTFILGYPNENSRDRLWNRFVTDEEWQKVYKESEANGPLVQKIDQVFMVFAPGLNATPKPNPSGIFQLRTYYCFDGKISNIQTRFKDHTQALFEKQGLRNYLYWLTVERDGRQAKLVYLLGHKDEATFNTAFQNFAKDPAWIKVRNASEADGKIVERVEAKFLKALPFSPMK